MVQGSSGGLTSITIQFRPYGVKLDFTPIVNDDGTIQLKVAPEVSALDYTNAVTISGYTIPAISTRRAETQVELRDGQSFAISGLLDHRTTDIFNKMPGIGDVPILGQLFRSKNVNHSTVELMVIVTPTIVDPLHDTAFPLHRNSRCRCSTPNNLTRKPVKQKPADATTTRDRGHSSDTERTQFGCFPGGAADCARRARRRWTRCASCASSMPWTLVQVDYENYFSTAKLPALTQRAIEAQACVAVVEFDKDPELALETAECLAPELLPQDRDSGSLFHHRSRPVAARHARGVQRISRQAVRLRRIHGCAHPARPSLVGHHRPSAKFGKDSFLLWRQRRRRHDYAGRPSGHVPGPGLRQESAADRQSRPVRPCSPLPGNGWKQPSLL